MTTRTKIEWRNDLDDALKRAKERSTAVYVDFFSPG